MEGENEMEMRIIVEKIIEIGRAVVVIEIDI